MSKRRMPFMLWEFRQIEIISFGGKEIMKASWTDQLRSLKERRSILMYGGIGTEHFVSGSPVKQTQRKAIAKDDYRYLEKERQRDSSPLLWSQLWSGHLQGIPHAVFLFWKPFFFFPPPFLILGFPQGH